MRPTHGSAFVLVVLFASSALSGCIAEEDGAIAVYVRGGPLEDLDHLFLRFDTIRVHRAGAEADAHDSDGPGWITISQNPQRVDLLNFTTEAARALVANASLTEGRYDQVLFEIGAARSVNGSGDATDLKIVTAEVRVEQGFEIFSGQTAQLVITFGLNETLLRDEDDPRLGLTVSSVAVDEDAGHLQRTVPDHGVPP